ncbi:MAG: biotin/acetyl-CoA-carboxylase ligase [Gammaproteobacteria bacterium]|jgi:BirA family biotin operon repressor/biotin-[acetyl-CoA-carboxylase] ligase|nr:biotin/acetyl-CoA-carboxylase ligase [Gammaproteobacteria bacterium]
MLKEYDIEFLSLEKIRAELGKKYEQQPPPIEILKTIDSTNAYLLRRLKQDPNSPYFCLAEEQTAGRGRRGRAWETGSTRNIALSCLWHFPQGAHTLSGLSLVVGIAVVTALDRLSKHNIMLKWPNDLIWEQQKLAGIAVEISMDNRGGCYAVIGIGLNVNLAEATRQTIEPAAQIAIAPTPWVDLHTVLGKPCSRNQVAGFMINELLTQLPLFEKEGLTPFLTAWSQKDMLYGQAVEVYTVNERIPGIMSGIDEQGALILQTEQGKQTFQMGEVTVRRK